MKITIQPLTAEQIGEFLAWEYDGPYAIYNMSEEDVEEGAGFFSDPANGYFAIVKEGDELSGFCNFGADAQVPGGSYEEEALDIGMGLRPDLTGQGNGAFYAAEVFDFARRRYAAQIQRVTIAAFNERAQRLYKKFGFQVSDRFHHKRDGRPFVIMTRQVESL